MWCLPRVFRPTNPRIAILVRPHRSLSLRPLPHGQSNYISASATAKGSRRKHTQFAPPIRILEASSSALGLLAAASLAIGAAVYYQIAHRSPPPISDDEVVPDFSKNGLSFSEKGARTIVVEITSEMASEIAPGRIGNLTPEQDEKLRQLWVTIARVCQFDLSVLESGDGMDGAGDGAALESVASAAPSDNKKKDKKKKRGLFKRSKKDASSADESNSTAAAPAKPTKPIGTVDLAAASEDDKYGQSKVFQNALASQTPESMRNTMWSMVKHDHPDALVLRFLRARKWNVDKALVMLISTMHWRAQDMHVDDDIMIKGEGGAVEELKTSTDEAAKTMSEDFLAQMRMGKSFLHGSDKLGRPICIVRVRLHHQGDQIEESVERCTVYTIETARMALQPPVDTATIIFDMTGFSLANMDYAPVNFMIKCFEANYPESLGAILVHKAPWLFQGIWRIIRNLLDPVVAAKVHFTNNVKDLEEYISRDQIIKELDGDEDWEYKYIEPEQGENETMKDTATRDRLLTEREDLYREFELATALWILHPEDKEIRAQRDGIAKRMRDDYWRLDPYVRARSLYDRVGMLRSGGAVDFYPKPKKDEITQTNGNATAQADVD